MRLALPANDDSNWRGPQYARRCDCGSFDFNVFLLDGYPRLVCSRCEQDHTCCFFARPMKPA